MQSSHKGRITSAITLFLSASACVLLVKIRASHSDNNTFYFLIWNLFLAFIPYLITSMMVVLDAHKSLWSMLIGYCSWLLFFPNAPYLMTDFLHLKERPDIGLWFDMSLIISFALTGLMAGYLSLIDVFCLVKRKFGKFVAWLTTLFSITAGSFGIYMGRYLRWNSWDIFFYPKAIIMDITSRILHPFAYPKTIGITLIFASMLLSGFILLMQLRENSDKTN
jgi:uncharacterized membrane protein